MKINAQHFEHWDTSYFPAQDWRPRPRVISAARPRHLLHNRRGFGRAGSRVDALTAFWLATAGGGIALDLPIGQFREGYQFDAIRIDGRAAGSNLKVEREDSAAEVLQKIIYHASCADIREVGVANRREHAA